MIDKTQRLYESLDSFLTEYKEKNEGNKYRPVAVGRYGIRTRESIYSKELAKDYSKNKLIFKNTLTVGMGSTQIDIGVLSDDATYAVSPAYHTYRINGINSDYLRYCLECRNQDMFVRYVKRGSRQGKSIDLKRWITYKIPVYPESVQAEIVKRLDSVKAILSLREQELNALDELIKARFVEMFGDAYSNPRGLPVLEWDDVFNTTTGKLDSNAATENGAYPFSTCSKEALRIDKYAFDQEALLLAGNNAAGKYDVKHYNGKFNAYQRTYVLSLKQEWSYALFKYQLEDKLVYLQQQSLGGLTKYLTMKILGDLTFLLPSMDEQKQFEDFVAQIDKSKLLSGCRLFHSWAPENRDKPKHVGVPRRKTKDLRGGRRQQCRWQT